MSEVAPDTTTAPEGLTLKPCPWCGHAGEMLGVRDVRNTGPGPYWHHRIDCGYCGAFAPNAPTETGAAEKWNRIARALTLKPPPAAGGERERALEDAVGALLEGAECSDWGECGIDNPQPITHRPGATCPVCVARALLAATPAPVDAPAGPGGAFLAARDAANAKAGPGSPDWSDCTCGKTPHDPTCAEAPFTEADMEEFDRQRAGLTPAPVDAGQGTPEPGRTPLMDVLTAAPLRKVDGHWQWWASHCSRHLFHEPTCDLCQTGDWADADERLIAAVDALAHPAPAPLGDGDARARVAELLEGEADRCERLARAAWEYPASMGDIAERHSDEAAAYRFAAAALRSRGPEPRVGALEDADREWLLAFVTRSREAAVAALDEHRKDKRVNAPGRAGGIAQCEKNIGRADRVLTALSPADTGGDDAKLSKPQADALDKMRQGWVYRQDWIGSRWSIPEGGDQYFFVPSIATIECLVRAGLVASERETGRRGLRAFRATPAGSGELDTGAST